MFIMDLFGDCKKFNFLCAIEWDEETGLQPCVRSHKECVIERAASFFPMENNLEQVNMLFQTLWHVMGGQNVQASDYQGNTGAWFK